MKLSSLRSRFVIFMMAFCAWTLKADVQWENIVPADNPGFAYSVDFGAGKFVVVTGGAPLYSLDNGLTWRMGLRPSLYGPNDSPFGLRTYTKQIYGGGWFVAISNTGSVSTSDDGIRWEVQNLFSSAISDIAYGSGKFVATSPRGEIAVSTNAEQWDIQKPTTNRISMITFGNGKFLAAVCDPASSIPISFAESTDEVLWTIRPAPQFYPMPDCQTNGCPQVTSASGLTFSGLKFVMVVGSAMGQSLIRSEDGINWIAGEKSFLDMTHGREANNVRDLNGELQPDHIAFGNGFYVTPGSRGPTVAQMAPVPQRPQSQIVQLNGVAARGPTIIGAGYVREINMNLESVSSPAFLMSTNGGATFEVRTNLTERTVSNVKFVNGKFVGLGGYGGVFESQSGLDWSWKPISSDTNLFLIDVAHHEGRWVGVGEGGAVSSEDGIHFSRADVGGNTNLFRVAGGGGRFVALGYAFADDASVSKYILTSSNGVDWIKAQTPTNSSFGYVAYGNGRFVVNGLWSVDGMNWQTVNWWPNLEIVFANGLFHARGGESILISSDGVTWSPIAGGAPRLAEPIGGWPGLAESDGAIWLFSSDRWYHRINRAAVSDIQLQAAAEEAGKVRIRLEVPGLGRYRVLKSSAPDGPWEMGESLDIGFRSGWDDSVIGSAGRFYRVVKE